MFDPRVEARTFSKIGGHLTGLLAECLTIGNNEALKPYGIKRISLYDQILIPNAGFNGLFGTGSIHFRHFKGPIEIAKGLGLPQARDELDIDIHLDVDTLKGALWFNRNFPNSTRINNPRTRFYFDEEGNYGVAARLFYALPGIDRKKVIFGIGREHWVQSSFEEDQVELIGAAYMRLITLAQEAATYVKTQVP